MIVPRINLARLPTPLIPLDSYSKRFEGVRLWMKRDDATESLAGGNKLRKLEYSLGQALEDKCDLLITCGGIQSNHCRATAAMAARLGLGCHLLLRGDEPDLADGNLLLDKVLGAEVSYLTGKEFAGLDEYKDKLISQYKEAGRRPFFIPVGASDEIGLWGYLNAAAELKEDFKNASLSPEYIVSATGSGGTLAGLIVGNIVHELKTKLVAFNITENEEYFVTRISHEIETWQQRYKETREAEIMARAAKPEINIIDGYVGQGYGKADAEVFRTIADLGRTEGVILDPVYTGKAFNALVHEIHKGTFNDAKNIVFIHTGGIYGIFPQKSEFLLG